MCHMAKWPGNCIVADALGGRMTGYSEFISHFAPLDFFLLISSEYLDLFYTILRYNGNPILILNFRLAND